MSDNAPPANVPELVAKVKRSTLRIQRHREAMARVAAEIAAKQAQQASDGGDNQ